MKHGEHPIPPSGTVPVPATDVDPAPPRERRVATRDHDVIRAWATRHQAEPATGEATASGSATTLNVNDGGAPIRFNFPGFARFRPIAWEEWFAHLERRHLAFVYEEDVSDRAYAIWQSRGGAHGHDQADWFEAEQQLREASHSPSARYGFVQYDSDEG